MFFLLIKVNFIIYKICLIDLDYNNIGWFVVENVKKNIIDYNINCCKDFGIVDILVFR